MNIIKYIIFKFNFVYSCCSLPQNIIYALVEYLFNFIQAQIVLAAAWVTACATSRIGTKISFREPST